MPNPTEKSLESLVLHHLQSQGWQITPPAEIPRPSKSETLLRHDLTPALHRLNPDLPTEALEAARDLLLEDRSASSRAQANRKSLEWLKNGIKVDFRDPKTAHDRTENVQLIDWNNPKNNTFRAVRQLPISGSHPTRYPDILAFVNGFPILFFELKATEKSPKSGYDRNLQRYLREIPNLFDFNGLVIFSNGLATRVGSFTAPWHHLAPWIRIHSEAEPGSPDLETNLRAVCPPERLLDLVENYILFHDGRQGTQKIVAKNHQYLGVEQALSNLRRNREVEKDGRLGVFWHTQGSGKSFSMMFFAQKTLRKIPGNWTFVVITDRLDLDDQIYRSFARAGVVTKEHTQAKSGAHLRRLLREDHRYIFTLIHKFRTPKGELHEVVSERDDILVLTDEAHRSQYDTLAMNMRAALPNASFLAFTGTPLLAGEERTREVFGDYVSVYDFQRSIDEGATVKLYYENRIPELQLANEHFEEDLERLLEEAELDAAQEERLEGEFARQYHLITRDDRLEKIARDLVRHFPNRGFLGKGMVVSIDKATTVRLHDKVRAAWDEEIADLRRRLEGAPTPEADTLRARLLWMEETDMAVVVSQSEDEAAKMRAKGADIAPHRARLEREPGIDEHFKDPGHPLRLVFICSMWLTGFDVESCSTLYLDKPMRNHTLMQAIARANRRFEGKGCGLIVDYVGVFAHLQDALAIYGKGESGAMPVSPKAELLAKLREKIAEIENLLRTHGIDLDALSYTERYADVAAMDRRATQALLDAANRLSRERTVKDDFLGRARHVGRLYRAILPDPMAGEVTPRCALIERLAEILRVNSERADISEVMRAVERLLDDSISASESYVIQNRPALRPLTAHSADTLRQRFENGWEHLLVDRLERDLVDKARDLARRNPSRRRLVERLEQLIADYNAGAQGAAEYFEKLLALLGEMTKEEARGLREELSEEELAIFDLLHPPKGLSKKEETRVKAAARNLVETLKTGKLTLDWRKRETTRAAVHMAIQETLDAHLQEETFPKDVFDAVCGAVYEHVFEAYHDDGHSVYAERPPEGGG